VGRLRRASAALSGIGVTLLVGVAGHLLGMPDLLSGLVGLLVGGALVPVDGRMPLAGVARWLVALRRQVTGGAWTTRASREQVPADGRHGNDAVAGHTHGDSARHSQAVGERHTQANAELDLGRVLSAPPQAHWLQPGQRFGLGLDELEHHLTTLGTTGSGKTTTLGRFMDAALAADWPVIVVDAKGGRLADFSRAVAARHQLPNRMWLPGEAESWSYDVCAGEPTVVANRLVGAFEHGRDAEVYRNLSQAILPLVGQALQSSGLRSDLDTLRRSLDRERLVGLVRRVSDPLLKAELLSLLDEDLYRRALAGLAGRLAALRHGAFGPWLVPSPRTLSLATCLDEPGVTYFGLPATGASEDVALVGKVLINDLKQLSYLSLRSQATRRGLIVVDEFATLREAEQLADLLLQAREARLALVVSSQFVPRAPALRHAVLGAGALVIHQLGSAEDADLIARTLGTRSTVEVSRQVQLAPNASVRRLIRPSAAYLVSPDELRRLAVGQAVVCVRHGDQRMATVQVDPLHI
jgi:type IV secretion system coupling TraD/TrwB family protein